MTNIFKKTIASVATKNVVLFLLKIDHEQWGEPFYFVNNTESITSNGIEYVPYNFEIGLSKATTDTPSQSNLVIEDIDRIVTAKVRAVTSAPTVTFSIILANTPNQIEKGPYEASMTQLSFAESIITSVLKRASILQNSLSGFSISPEYFPAFFID